jgi:hypothetical protein
MGVSTDGILFYGIPVEEDSDVHERINDKDTSEGTIARLRNYGESDMGISIGTHCSGEYPMYYIYACDQTASRGSAVEVDFEVKSSWDRNLRAFCKKHNVPWEQPKWWLVSYWG